MTLEPVTIKQIVDVLRSEELLPENSDDRVSTFLEQSQELQPWYIRSMVGFGAWLASLLLIGFVALVGFANETGFIIVGALFIGAATFGRRQSDNDFVVQSALASSLAGQALLAFGIVEVFNLDEFDALLSIVILLNSFLFFVFPDRTHRVLSILISMSSLAVLIYHWELNVIVPLVGPVLAAAMLFVHIQQGTLIERGFGHLSGPLISGLMLSAFGFLLLSTVYILPELNWEFAFYPRPWISTLLLGGLLLYAGNRVWSQIGEVTGGMEKQVFFGILLAIIAAAWSIPGLLLALIVTLAGASSGNRLMIGAGIGFLVVFFATYFYGIQVSMLTKSISLLATGTAILGARWLLLRVSTQNAAGGEEHA